MNVNLDRGYDINKSRTPLGESGFTGEIARKGAPAPIQAGNLHLAATPVTLRLLIRRSTSRYRWDGHPATRRLT